MMDIARQRAIAQWLQEVYRAAAEHKITDLECVVTFSREAATLLASMAHTGDVTPRPLGVPVDSCPWCSAALSYGDRCTCDANCGFADCWARSAGNRERIESEIRAGWLPRGRRIVGASGTLVTGSGAIALVENDPADLRENITPVAAADFVNPSR